MTSSSERVALPPPPQDMFVERKCGSVQRSDGTRGGGDGENSGDREYVAARDIPAGTLLLSSFPYVVAPFYDLLTNTALAAAAHAAAGEQMNEETVSEKGHQASRPGGKKKQKEAKKKWKEIRLRRSLITEEQSRMPPTTVTTNTTAASPHTVYHLRHPGWCASCFRCIPTGTILQNREALQRTAVDISVEQLLLRREMLRRKKQASAEGEPHTGEAPEENEDESEEEKEEKEEHHHDPPALMTAQESFSSSSHAAGLRSMKGDGDDDDDDDEKEEEEGREEKYTGAESLLTTRRPREYRGRNGVRKSRKPPPPPPPPRGASGKSLGTSKETTMKKKEQLQRKPLPETLKERLEAEAAAEVEAFVEAYCKAKWLPRHPMRFISLDNDVEDEDRQESPSLPSSFSSREQEKEEEEIKSSSSFFSSSFRKGYGGVFWDVPVASISCWNHPGEAAAPLDTVPPLGGNTTSREEGSPRPTRTRHHDLTASPMPSFVVSLPGEKKKKEEEEENPYTNTCEGMGMDKTTLDKKENDGHRSEKVAPCGAMGIDTEGVTRGGQKSPFLSLKKEEQEKIDEERVLHGCAGCEHCGVYLYCSPTCWDAARRHHARSGECVVLRRIFFPLMEQYFSPGKPSSRWRGTTKGALSQALETRETHWPGTEPLRWTKRCGVEKSAEMHMLWMTALFAGTTAMEGKSNRLHTTDTGSKKGMISLSPTFAPFFGSLKKGGEEEEDGVPHSPIPRGTLDAEAAPLTGVLPPSSSSDTTNICPGGPQEEQDAPAGLPSTSTPFRTGGVVLGYSSPLLSPDIEVLDAAVAKGPTSTIDPSSHSTTPEDDAAEAAQVSSQPEVRNKNEIFCSRLKNTTSDTEGTRIGVVGWDRREDELWEEDLLGVAATSSSPFSFLPPSSFSGVPSSSSSRFWYQQQVRVPTYREVADLITNFSKLSREQTRLYRMWWQKYQKKMTPLLQLAWKWRRTSHGGPTNGILRGWDHEVEREEENTDASALAMSEDYFYRLAAALQCNSFGIFSPQDQCLASGLYPEASLFNHSCAPNICRVMRAGRVACFYALQPISKGDPLNISYIDVSIQSTAERRKLLFGNYRFFCYCPRCRVNSRPSKTSTTGSASTWTTTTSLSRASRTETWTPTKEEDLQKTAVQDVEGLSTPPEKKLHPRLKTASTTEKEEYGDQTFAAPSFTSSFPSPPPSTGTSPFFILECNRCEARGYLRPLRYTSRSSFLRSPSSMGMTTTSCSFVEQPAVREEPAEIDHDRARRVPAGVGKDVVLLACSTCRQRVWWYPNHKRGA